jgi:mRNA-degrading endonuclease YafQ of YafQ-DinJ toxin-antitoxin module
VTGSRPLSIEASSNFKRTFKKLAKAYQKDFEGIVATALEALMVRSNPTEILKKKEGTRRSCLGRQWAVRRLQHSGISWNELINKLGKKNILLLRIGINHHLWQLPPTRSCTEVNAALLASARAAGLCLSR